MFTTLAWLLRPWEAPEDNSLDRLRSTSRTRQERPELLEPTSHCQVCRTAHPWCSCSLSAWVCQQGRKAKNSRWTAHAQSYWAHGWVFTVLLLHEMWSCVSLVDKRLESWDSLLCPDGRDHSVLWNEPHSGEAWQFWLLSCWPHLVSTMTWETGLMEAPTSCGSTSWTTSPQKQGGLAG